jgi:hypothetical protein
MATKLAQIVSADPDLTLKLLAKTTGISYTAIKEMAAGIKPILPHHAKKIAKALDMDPADLE